MINSKKDFSRYLIQDKRALCIDYKRPRLLGDDIWKFEIALRKVEYYMNCKPYFYRIPLAINRLKKYQYGIRCGFSIPPNVFAEGLALVHYGTVVVSSGARIGRNCRIHEDVTIGATNHETDAAIIGDNCFIGTGAKIIGRVNIADDVEIAAGAIVTKNILEKGITVGGNPAKKISNNSSRMNLPFSLFNEENKSI